MHQRLNRSDDEFALEKIAFNNTILMSAHSIVRSGGNIHHDVLEHAAKVDRVAQMDYWAILRSDELLRILNE